MRGRESSKPAKWWVFQLSTCECFPVYEISIDAKWSENKREKVKFKQKQTKNTQNVVKSSWHLQTNRKSTKYKNQHSRRCRCAATVATLYKYSWKWLRIYTVHREAVEVTSGVILLAFIGTEANSYQLFIWSFVCWLVLIVHISPFSAFECGL